MNTEIIIFQKNTQGTRRAKTLEFYCFKRSRNKSLWRGNRLGKKTFGKSRWCWKMKLSLL